MRIWPEKTVDQEFADLGAAGWSGTLNDRQFAYLRNAGYTGGLPDMMFQLRTAPVVPSFSPADLFTGTDEGFWAPVETSRLWQDTARTTPVTTSGQPIASWELTTRTGVIYATQSNNSLRPTYNVDGNGRGRIQFGAGTFLETSTITPASDKAQVFVTYSRVTDGTMALVESSTSTDSNNGCLALLQVFGGTRARSKGTTIQDATAVTSTIPAQSVISGIFDISGDSAALRVDGVQQAINTADQGTGNYLAHAVYIGARSGGGIPNDGAFYGLIVRFGPALTAGQLTDAETWMDALRNP